MELLELKTKLAQLRLSTLTYIQEEPRAVSLYCFDDLIEMRNLSNLMIDQMDDLRAKLDKIPDGTFDHQIGSQQLMYFVSVWYDSLAPKINTTFDMASDQKIPLWESNEKRQPNPANQLALHPIESGGDSRLRESLMRLKQSMGENENLIANIANNIEDTKVTIDTIYDTLHDTKQTLQKGQANTIEAINIINHSRTCRMVSLIIVIAIMVVVFYFLFRLVFRL